MHFLQAVFSVYMECTPSASVERWDGSGMMFWTEELYGLSLRLISKCDGFGVSAICKVLYFVCVCQQVQMNSYFESNLKEFEFSLIGILAVDVIS